MFIVQCSLSYLTVSGKRRHDVSLCVVNIVHIDSSSQDMIFKSGAV